MGNTLTDLAARTLHEHLVEASAGDPVMRAALEVVDAAFPTATFAEPDTSPEHDIIAAVTQAIRDHAEDRPRSRQRAIGPSQVGEPCLRKLGYAMLDWPRTNTGNDPWPSEVGTAVHGYLEQVFGHPRHQGRYLVEQRLRVAEGLAGTCDLYDTVTETVMDHKVLGATSLAKYRKEGPSDTYRVQAHLYGLGVVNTLGRTPKRVALLMYPRGGMLSGLHVWSEPYDQAVALAALDRKDQLLGILASLEVAGDDGRRSIPDAHWRLIPTADSNCSWCSFFVPHSTDLAVGCPGHEATQIPSTATAAGVSEAQRKAAAA